MPRLPIDLDWHLDSGGYRLIEHGKLGGVVAAKGGKVKHTRPLDKLDGLFEIFAKIRTPPGLLAFVETHGLLFDHSYRGSFKASLLEKSAADDSPLGHYKRQIAKASANLTICESVADHLKTAEFFRKIMLHSKKGWRRVPRDLSLDLSLELHRQTLGEIRLHDDLDRGFRLFFTTSSLMNGLWLQLAGSISGGATYKQCARCGELFETGIGSNRRSDSKFCSDTHRIEFNSRERSQRR